MERMIWELSWSSDGSLSIQKPWLNSFKRREEAPLQPEKQQFWIRVSELLASCEAETQAQFLLQASKCKVFKPKTIEPPRHEVQIQHEQITLQLSSFYPHWESKLCHNWKKQDISQSANLHCALKQASNAIAALHTNECFPTLLTFTDRASCKPC